MLSFILYIARAAIANEFYERNENAGNLANTKLNAIYQPRGETRENRRREGFFLLNFEDIPRLRRKDPRYGVDTTKGL